MNTQQYELKAVLILKKIGVLLVGLARRYKYKIPQKTPQKRFLR